MEPEQRNRWSGMASAGSTLFWLFLILVFAQQWYAQFEMQRGRTRLLDEFQRSRGSRVIAMIHRQETIASLGLPISSYISIEDSEQVLRAIRLTPDDQPIDMILHTPGGLVLAAEQIAGALAGHKGNVTVFVPHYAMSGGTLLSLAADETVMDRNAVLDPVDPQLGDLPAAPIVKVLDLKKPGDIDDRTLMLAGMAQKSRNQVTEFVTKLLREHFPEDKARDLGATLTEGRWTHDFPITVDRLREFGLTVSSEMSHLVYELMDLYPQAGTSRPSVLYVPLPGAANQQENSQASSPEW